VGIGKFVGIKYVAAGEGPSDQTDYMFIEYADGMAKLPVKQAGRLLYRYNLYVSPLFSQVNLTDIPTKMTK
jgi:transcription-repair coupling factor (superfamily II helicase)